MKYLSKQTLRNYFLFLLIFYLILSAAYKFLLGMPPHITPRFYRLFRNFSGTLAYGFFSLSLLLSMRSAIMEKYFGGLDKMYSLHHKLGLVSFACVLLHPISFALRKTAEYK